jgi:hypothetical protein
MHSSRSVPATILVAALLLAACHRTTTSRTGSGGGAAASPRAQGVALFLDLDRNGEANEGDELRLTFDLPLALSGAQASDLALAVAGDSFGVGASVQLGAHASVLRVVLGSDPHLKSRQRFDPADSAANAPSAIDIAAQAAPGAIKAQASGADASPSADGPRDIAPGFVLGEQVIDEDVIDAVLGDLDCDGVLDIVCARMVVDGKGGGFTQVCVHRGLGDGTFMRVDQLFVSPVATCLALADVDGNGRPDVALGTEDSDYILRNDSAAPGEIGLQFSFELSAHTITRALAFADLDGDGDPDLVAADVENVRVYANEGGFSFANALDVLGAPIATEALAIGDLNADGRPDLCLGQDGPNPVLLGDGSLGFAESASLGSSATRALALGDVDGDGDLDLAAGNALADVIWLGDGAGGFQLGSATPAEAETSACALIDVDGDAALDWLRVNAGALRVASGDGLGAFDDTGQALPAAGARTLPLGDVDGDGDVDTAIAAGALRVVQGSLAGTWGTHSFRATGIDIGVGRVLCVELADWDGDGDLDLAQGYDQRVELRQNLGDGTFGPPTVLDVGVARVTDLEFGDVDQDGDLDLLAALIGADTGLWLQDAGAFNAAPQFVPSSRPSNAIALGDIDGDGDLDYVLGTLRLSHSEVMRNDGFSDKEPGAVWQGFVGPVQELGAELTSDVELADLDCDGDLDLFAANGFGESDRVYLNEGGVFVGRQALGPTNTRSVSIIDVDRDGDLDLVRGTPQREELWLNDGAGTFTFMTEFGGHNSFATLARDLDGDGRPDLLVGNDQLPGVWLYPGSGAGFGPVAQKLQELLVLSLAVGDLDRDGDLELVAPSAEEGGAGRVYFTR